MACVALVLSVQEKTRWIVMVGYDDRQWVTRNKLNEIGVLLCVTQRRRETPDRVGVRYDGW